MQKPIDFVRIYFRHQTEEMRRRITRGGFPPEEIEAYECIEEALAELLAELEVTMAPGVGVEPTSRASVHAVTDSAERSGELPK